MGLPVRQVLVSIVLAWAALFVPSFGSSIDQSAFTSINLLGGSDELGASELESIRGSDWGGGIGGVLYTIRGNGYRGQSTGL